MIEDAKDIKNPIVEEKAPVKPVVSKKVETFKFDEKEFKVLTEKQRNGQIIEEMDFRPEYKHHHGKCLYRTCKHFDVSLKHLKKAAMVLNYRKIDGILVNHLLGRYGFYDGGQRNRSDVALEYKIPIMGVEIAEMRLEEIIQSKNVKKAYADYMQEYKDAHERSIDKHVQTGGDLDE
jgi:hypothetical protein